jgi:hypothetical protein
VNTIAGYEEHHSQRPDPLATKGDVVGQMRFIERTLGAAV